MEENGFTVYFSSGETVKYCCGFVFWCNTSTSFRQFMFSSQTKCTGFIYDTKISDRINTFFNLRCFQNLPFFFFFGLDCSPSVMDAFSSTISACSRQRQNLMYLSSEPEHTAQSICYCKSQTEMLLSFPQQACQLYYPVCCMKSNAVFPSPPPPKSPLGGYSKDTQVVIWRCSKTSQKYSSPGPNVFPISTESIQCFGILLAAYPSICHPTCTHTPISLAARSAERITNASGKTKIKRKTLQCWESSQ